VKRTPQAKKTALFNLDDDSDNDGYESEDAGPAKAHVRPIFDDLKGNEASSDEETWLESSSLSCPRYGNRLNKRFILDSDSEESVTGVNDHQESTVPDNVEELVPPVDEESEYHTDDSRLDDDDQRSTDGSDIISEHGSDTTPEHESIDRNESSSSYDSSQGETSRTEAPLKCGHTADKAIVLSSDDETDAYDTDKADRRSSDDVTDDDKGRSASLKKSGAGNRPPEPVAKSRLRSARKDITPTSMLLRRSARSQALSKQEGRYALRSLSLNCSRSTTLETEALTSDDDSEKSDGIERNRSPRTPMEGQAIPSTVISRMKRYDGSRARSGARTDSFLGTSRKRRYARVDRKKNKWARRDDDDSDASYSDASYSEVLKDEGILYEESNSEGESDRTADKTEQAFNLSFKTNESSSGQDHDEDGSDYQDDDSDDASTEDDYNDRIRVVSPLPVTRPDELGFFL
jgi:hypothetical protein